MQDDTNAVTLWQGQRVACTRHTLSSDTVQLQRVVWQWESNDNDEWALSAFSLGDLFPTLTVERAVQTLYQVHAPHWEDVSSDEMAGIVGI